MTKVTVITNLTLDGVMQAPARPDEDTRDGFTHGGWAAPYNAMMALFSQAQGGGGASGANAFLFGRRTYEDFYAVWPNRGNNPFTAVFDNTQKYVASTTLKEPLPWRNSTLLQGDAAGAVAALKEQQLDTEFLIFGSGVLVQSLMRANLIDEYILLIHPLVLGSGHRLFPEGSAATLRLVSSQTTPTGVVIATYHPADKAQP